MAIENIIANHSVDRTEKRVLFGAVAFVAVSLLLIAYATWGLGINVPACIPPGQGFNTASITKHQGNNYEIHYLAKMWAFEPRVVRVPTGSMVDIFAVSKDVTHGLQIAGTNLNLMVVPGAVANGRIHFVRPGTYLIVCQEFCGSAHQEMNARIEVRDDLTDISAEGLPDTGGSANTLFQEKGCSACHSIDGTAGVGPTLKGAWGSSVVLTDGSVHVLDQTFFREMLKNPAKNVVKDYPPVMPELPLTDADIKLLEDYVKGLK